MARDQVEMPNLDTLTQMAARAGFRSVVITPSHDAISAQQGGLTAEGKALESLSVGVAALPCPSATRYQPFNARRDDDDQQVARHARWLNEAARALTPNGLMFVYGLPRHLVRYGVALADGLTFRYWVAVRTMSATQPHGLRPEHTGLLVLSKPGANVNRLRIPHARCRACDNPLKDWGGKSHLMRADGVALSDVWMDLVVDPDERLPMEVFARILDLAASADRTTLALLVPDGANAARSQDLYDRAEIIAFNPLERTSAYTASAAGRAIPAQLLNTLHKAPCLEVLRAIPSETVDLAFADPPFNLTKPYNNCADDRAAHDYLGWCKRWLIEYERVLKPGGAMFILNLPKWSVWLADFLSRTGKLYLRNWIVWNSLPEPKGVLMPAHYGLLYFTKGEHAARFNYCSMERGWEPFAEAVFPPDRADVCQRRSCVRKRRAAGRPWRGELTDIWHDVPRERRPIKTPVDQKAHPCETPERLIDRIVRLTTNPGDVVLDAFAGTGTTAFVAQRLGRRFIAIEKDADYVQVASRRLSERRSSWQRARVRTWRREVTKRALQMELHRLALLLGRLPTRSDVERLSKHSLATFDEAFASWAVALKAAKAIGNCPPAIAFEQPPAEQLEMFDANNPAAMCAASKPEGKQPPLDERHIKDEDLHGAPVSDAREDEPSGSTYSVS